MFFAKSSLVGNTIDFLLIKNIMKKILYIVGGFILLITTLSIVSSSKSESVIQDTFVPREIVVATTTNSEKVSTSTSNTTATTKPISTSTTPKVAKTVEDTNPVQQYTYYEVSSVVDGDTIKIKMNGDIIALRLIGIDTPETVDPRKEVQCFGIEASNKAKELLTGKKVRIEKDPTQGELDKYGRTLAYIYREDNLFYNKYMIEQGYAHEYTYNTPYKYQIDFKNAQNYAQTNKLGLWSSNTCNGDTTSSVTTPQTTTATTSTGIKYYASSASNATKYYPETCSAWQNLSKTNLRVFNSLDELLSVYPTRTLAESCK